MRPLSCSNLLSQSLQEMVFSGCLSSGELWTGGVLPNNFTLPKMSFIGFSDLLRRRFLIASVWSRALWWLKRMQLEKDFSQMEQIILRSRWLCWMWSKIRFLFSDGRLSQELQEKHILSFWLFVVRYFWVTSFTSFLLTILRAPSTESFFIRLWEFSPPWLLFGAFLFLVRICEWIQWPSSKGFSSIVSGFKATGSTKAAIAISASLSDLMWLAIISR